MAMIKVPFSRVQEETIAPKGTYDLVLRKIGFRQNKRGTHTMIEAMIGFDGGDYLPFTEYFTIPNEYDEEQAVARMVRQLRRFFETFGIEMSDDAIDENLVLDAKGNVARCDVRVEEDRNGEYPPKNRLSLRAKRDDPSSEIPF